MRADRLRPFLLAMLLPLGACLTPTDATRVPVAQVRVTLGDHDGTTDTIQVRGTTRVHAAALAREGYDIGETRFAYASSDTSIAVVDSLGTVRGVAPGTATISATAPQGKSGHATVVVVPATIAYTIDVGSQPGAIAFSTDYTRAYALTAPDSLVVIDALGFFRSAALALGHPAAALAATSTSIYATHPDIDSVTVVSAATNEVTGRIWVGAGPEGAVGSGDRAYIATRYDRKVVILDHGALTLGIPVGGEPHALAISGDGSRLFATVRRDDGWYLLAIAPSYPDTLGSVALPAPPIAVTASADGSRAWVLLASPARVVAIADTARDGHLAIAGSATVGSGATGISARWTGRADVVVSGDPLLVLDGATLDETVRIPGAGMGWVTVRPDGLFAFIGAPQSGLIDVIGL